MSAESSAAQRSLLHALFGDKPQPFAMSRESFEFSLEHRLFPFVVKAIADGRVILDESIGARELDESIGALLATQLRVEMALSALAELLDGAGLEFRVLKGLATAHLDHDDPALRSFGDVDVLIDEADADRVVEVLTASDLGTFMTVRGGDGRIQHAITFVLDGVEIDLHRRLLHQGAGHLAARLDLLSDSERFEIDGREFAALPRPLRLLQAAGQNVLSAPRDRKYTSDIDVFVLRGANDEARVLARSVGLGWVLDAGMRRSMSVLGWSDGHWIDGEQVPALGLRDRMFERVYGSGGAAPGQAVLLELTCASPRVAARILRSVVLPGEEYLARRGRTPLGQLRHQVRRVLGRPVRR